MNCNEALKAIHEVLDGEASPEVTAALEAHRLHCPACAREWEELAHWDHVLRAAEPDQPSDAYFASLAGAVSTRVRGKSPKPAALVAPSWGFAWGLAALCLLLGLGLGRLALPGRTEQAATVVRTVAGPVREVTVEKVVEKRVPVVVQVPVVQWRTRTVTREVPMTVASAAAPATVDALAPRATAARAGDLSTAAGVYGTAAGDSIHLAGLRVGGRTAEDSGLSRTEITALARRFTTDAQVLDEAIDAHQLATALATDVNRADTELRKALDTATPEAAPR